MEQSIDRVFYYHGDHLNSSTYVTDDIGRPVAYYDYLPFGEVAVEHNQTTNFNNGYKFNAKELDEATGMSYYGARYYDPRISVFVSVDPLAEETFEPYSYVGNNPIMFTDPTGMNKVGNKWWENFKKKMTKAKIKADIERNKELSGYNHFVNWFKENLKLKETPKRKKIRSNKDIGSSVKSKYGGGEQPTTTGNYKKGKHGGVYNVDYFLDIVNTYGNIYKGKKYNNPKEKVEVVKDVVNGLNIGQEAAEKTQETIKEFKVVSEKKYDLKTNQTIFEFKVFEVEKKQDNKPNNSNVKQ